MKISITAETFGTEIIGIICSNLNSSEYKIDPKREEIKTQVQNKEGKWVEFDPAKIRFLYEK